MKILLPRILFGLILSVLSCGALAAGAAPRQLGVGLYGANGHQLTPSSLLNRTHSRIVAVSQVRGPLPANAGIKEYPTLDALLADPAVEIVSLCSPRRADQARDAIRALKAGKHVYAEKPCALTEPELDEVLAVARSTGREFHEMAGTVFVQPYLEMRRLVKAGAVGEVIQVLVQKSYPYGPGRPQDEAIDGGLFLQAGIHAIRMVEHAAGVRVRSISGWETNLGRPEEVGAGKVAAAVQMTLENGGLATIVMNYLNAVNFKPRNNETLRIFGTKGFVESVDDGSRSKRLVTLDGKSVDPIDTSAAPTDYFDFMTAHLVTGAAMPFTLEEELHPLRMLLRGKQKIQFEPAPKNPAKIQIPSAK
ncbi:MAG: Gfo/Idh/MocA family oxidoreductase [Opitutus sp.]|nr:Gfo/Idh/MocA family oxidoreductase [Opitutus sp.]